MTYEVKEIETISGETIINVFRTDEDGTVWVIPADFSNSDYQAYLAWVEENK